MFDHRLAPKQFYIIIHHQQGTVSENRFNRIKEENDKYLSINRILAVSI